MGCPNWWLYPIIEAFYRPEWSKGGTTWKWILTIFKYKNECYKQLEWKKLMKKNGGICQVSMFPSLGMVLKLSKKVRFSQFRADLSKKPKCVKAIYVHASESSHRTLSESDMVYRGLSHRSWDISDENTKKDTENSLTSNPTISETASHSIINNSISRKCVTRPIMMHLCKLL